MENGKWTVGQDPNDKNCVYVESDDFTHDVYLYISGDFEDSQQTLAYAEEIARRLNAFKGVI